MQSQEQQEAASAGDVSVPGQLSWHAFAQMANDPRVRRLPADWKLIIPDCVYFVGGYHHTCDDSVTYFDLDRLPATHYQLFRRAQRAMDEARQRNAHERRRRFMSADLPMSASDALRHVEARAEDLSQTRPEYGHCTNAVCVVGRRQRTRGLFMDRRAFLTSYDCRQDPDQQMLRSLLRAVIPVCTGISLEYYFSRVDPAGFGCATKLPHNITGLLAVMDGAASDLRTGLPWQMVEIHEPMRIIFVIETSPEALGVSQADVNAYQAALAVAVAAAVLQIAFGLLKAGILGEFFPTTVVHGMLAAIGVIIISKQIPVVLGVSAKGEPLHLLAHVPQFIREANPAIAAIGLVGLVIMFFWPLLALRYKWLKGIPAQLIVALVAVTLGLVFDLLHPHSYTLLHRKYQLSDQYLVAMPNRVFGLFDEITHPNFAVLGDPVAWKWVGMFFLIGTLESMLSAKAVDLIDPWKRRANLDRDIIAVGVANLVSASIGGLPMVSEIVRSRANIDNGARTRFANFWHGVLLLVCVAFLPQLLHLIPLAALAAMLVYTGYRLAHPREFFHVYHIGREQLIIFAATLIGVLATDLLIGVGIGIAVKLVIHVLNGVPLRSLFKPHLGVQQEDAYTLRVIARESAVFTNWIPFRRQLERLAIVENQNIVLDLADAKLIDHTVTDKLRELQRALADEGRRLELVGLEAHIPVSDHELAARRRRLVRVRRLVIITHERSARRLVEEFASFGVSGYTWIPCQGAGRRAMAKGHWQPEDQVRLEVIVPHPLAEKLLEHLRRNVAADLRATACVETVEAVFPDQFAAAPLPANVPTHPRASGPRPASISPH